MPFFRRSKTGKEMRVLRTRMYGVLGKRITGQKTHQQERAVDSVRNPAVRSETFRMPLHSHDRERLMIQTFNDPVISVLHYGKLMAGFFNPLVVGAVNDKTAAIEPVRNGIGQCRGEMVTVRPVKGMCQISGQVLTDRASEIDIDQLHAFTYAKHRLCSGNKAVQQFQLSPVKQRFYLPGAMVGLVEQNGVDIAAARKEQSVIIMDEKRIFQGL